MSADSPTEAVAVITDLDYLDSLCDGTYFLNFGICNISPDATTEAVALITDLDYHDWL